MSIRTLFKWTVVYLIFTTVLSCIGYFLLLYGGHISQSEGGRNIFLLSGEVIMWPWIISDFVLKNFDENYERLGLVTGWISQYIGYLLLFIIFHAVVRRVRL
jgi:hypothetical protein